MIIYIKDEILVGTNEVVITSDDKILYTQDLHYCVAILVTGDETGLYHLELRENMEDK